jgi:Na+/melibiose symporter-like transporter
MSDLPPIGTPAVLETKKRERGRLASWVRHPKTIAGAVIVALTAWFVLANNDETRIHFWVVWVSAKLWIAFVINFAAGLIVGYMLKRRGVRKR